MLVVVAAEEKEDRGRKEVVVTKKDRGDEGGGRGGLPLHALPLSPPLISLTTRCEKATQHSKSLTHHPHATNTSEITECPSMFGQPSKENVACPASRFVIGKGHGYVILEEKDTNVCFCRDYLRLYIIGIGKG